MRNPLLLSVLLSLGPLMAAAQAQPNGRVLDRGTRQPVPYASVVVAGTPLSTTSNAEGKFMLRVHQLPAKMLVFSQQTEYGQAFCRQLTRNANEPTEVWDVKASSAGPNGSRLAQVGYAS